MILSDSGRAGRLALVTGCAGFIGSHLCEQLLEDGWEVRGVDALTDYYSPLRKAVHLEPLLPHPRFSFHALDLATDPLEELVRDVGAVFHLAGQPGVRDSFGASFATYVSCNVVATQRLLEAVSPTPPRTFVYASSSSIYGDAISYPTAETAPRQPRSPYGMTKCATEDLAATYFRLAGIPAIGLRYFTVYGPRQRPDMAFSRFIERALAGRALTVNGDGQQIRDFTFVGDAVAATIAAAERGTPGSVYNVGGGSPIALSGVIGILGQLLGTDLAVERRPAARGDVRCTTADTTRARHELGLCPQTTIERGLALQLEWVIQHATQREEHRGVVSRGLNVRPDNRRSGVRESGTTGAPGRA